MDYNKPIDYERFLELKKAGETVFCDDEEIPLKDVCDYDDISFCVEKGNDELCYLFCDVYEFSASDRKKMAEQSKKANIEFNNFLQKAFDAIKGIK